MGQLPDHSPVSKFKSLPARILTAFVLAVVAMGACLGGSITFSILCIALVGILLFELGGLQLPPITRSKKTALVFFGCAVMAGIALHFLLDEPDFTLLTILMIILACGFGILLRFNIPLVLCGSGILLAVQGYLLTYLEDRLVFILAVLLIVGTDVGGYFFGKLIGGPKIVPKISPNKTWSGTIGGWVMAILIIIGVAFFTANEIPSTGIILLVIVLSIFSQLGDISISLLKRKVGVKDSSNLLPGHGGFLDRFDSFIGAGVLIFLLTLINGYLIH